MRHRRSPKTKRLDHGLLFTRGQERRTQENGSVLVEFALVVPILLLFLFGIIDFSLVMYDYINVRQGTSATAREAAVIATNPPPAASSSCVTAGSFSGATLNLICYAKHLLGSNEANTRVSFWFSTSNCTGSTCYAAGSPVVICTQEKASSTTGLFAPILGHVVLASKVEISIESSDPDQTLVPAQETPLTAAWPADCSKP